MTKFEPAYPTAKRITDKLDVAPQLGLTEFSLLAKTGFNIIIRDRPTGEQPDLPNAVAEPWVLDTHPHADHVDATNYLHEKTGASTASGAYVAEVQLL
ncbi:MAG: sulfur transferase domain-containing protein [Acidocella sp.]|nr:sulfur transferase domain-containing protein [Acidocella sp.]